MTTQTSKSLEQSIAAVDALDLDLIKFKATRQEDGYGWSEQHADQMAREYKRFLILSAKHPELMLAPDQDVDRFWHMHILDTQKYAQDCEEVFGYFLHHFPYLGLRGEGDEEVLQDSFESMQSLYKEQFGEDMLEVRAAWCGKGAPQADAAWCGKAAPQAAWCGKSAEPIEAAWCGKSSPTLEAAWCGKSMPTVEAAWCGKGAPALEPAWCGKSAATVTAAWCGKSTPVLKAAWCGKSTPALAAAWCGKAA